MQCSVKDPYEKWHGGGNEGDFKMVNIKSKHTCSPSCGSGGEGTGQGKERTLQGEGVNLSVNV